MIYRVLIVDDELPARNKIKLFLADHKEIEVVGEAGNGMECIDKIEEFSPDILFLDIQMPIMTGIEVLEHLEPEQLPVTIFTTAYDQYAIKAFDVQAVDYLLKPFDEDRFNLALKRAQERFGNSELEKEKMVRLRSQFHPEATYSSRFLVKENSSLVFLKTEEIDWLESSGNYILFYSGDREYMIRNTMKIIEEKLDPELFVRIHRSYMVRLDFIQEIQLLKVGEYNILLKNGRQLTLGKKYKNRLMELKV